MSEDTYGQAFRRRILNRLIAPPTRLGLAGMKMHVLTVRGRRAGRPHSTPVKLVIDGDRRWLVAP